MASNPHPSNEGAWSELERGFFAAAPPEVPEPPPEPMRFDDLDPVGPPPPQKWRLQLSRAWAVTSPARRMLRSVTPPLAAGARAILRGGRAQAARLAVMLRNISRDRRLVAVAAAALFVVTSISAGVVASRGSPRKPSESVAVNLGGVAGPVVSEAAPPPPAAAAPLEEDVSSSSSESIVPEMAPPPRHKRSKHAKGPARHAAHAKTTGKVATRSAARPASAR